MFLFRSFVFYPLLALAAAGLIVLSLGPQPWAPRTPASQSGAPGADNMVRFGPAALARMDPGPGHIVFSPRTAAGRAQTLHIAIKKGQPTTPGAADLGARLLLADATAKRFAGQAVTVEVDFRPAPISSAPQLAVSWQGADAAAIWQPVETGAEEKTLSFALPATAAPQAIGLYVINPLGNEAFALEIKEVRLSAQSPPG